MLILSCLSFFKLEGSTLLTSYAEASFETSRLSSSMQSMCGVERASRHSAAMHCPSACSLQCLLIALSHVLHEPEARLASIAISAQNGPESFARCHA